MFITTVDWNAVTAISNIILAFLTFVAIVVSLYFSSLSIRSRVRVYYKFNKRHAFNNRHVFSIVNKGIAPVKISKGGIIIHKFWWKKKAVVTIKKETLGKTLEHSNSAHLNISDQDISQKLMDNGYNVGDDVKIVVFFIDSFNKIHSKTAKITVTKSEIELKLNK